MSDKKLILFTDLIGRTIIGELNSEDEQSATELIVDNPAIVHIQPIKGGAPGQLQVQLLPFIIQEFVAQSKRKDPVTWSFSLNSVNIPRNLEIDPQLITQYGRLFNPSPIIVPPSETPVINLFDEKK